MDFLEDLDDLEGECLHFFLEEPAVDATIARSLAGATVVTSGWESRVSTDESRSGTEGDGPASRSEPFPSAEA